ncbi:hypothetical protein HX021_13480 [Sphingobacterium sp. N143]|uniref:hypothetical protein n=1 Tax=Sphingobacterium sp. N143 TaxID=2746727 RepID=UPI0025771919|nr:hypothetical protein [Sphingobacterium sp. N143]MDM1295294.1 hypothetical protein [Sphingobacterium sp. N143]
MATKRNSWLRASALALLGLGLAYGTQSFIEKEEVKVEPNTTATRANQTWYNNELVDSDPTNPANYALTPKFECGDKTEEICSISAPDDGSGQPDMTYVQSSGSTVESEIQDAESTLNPNTTVQAFRSNH